MYAVGRTYIFVLLRAIDFLDIWNLYLYVCLYLYITLGTDFVASFNVIYLQDISLGRLHRYTLLCFAFGYVHRSL